MEANGYTPKEVEEMCEKYPAPKELFELKDDMNKVYRRHYYITAGFKAFGKRIPERPEILKCKDLEYYEHQITRVRNPLEVKICSSGLHFCPEFQHVFDYYEMDIRTPVAFVYAIVNCDMDHGFYEYDAVWPRYVAPELPAPMHLIERPKKLVSPALYVAHVLTQEEIVKYTQDTITHWDNALSYRYCGPNRSDIIAEAWNNFLVHPDWYDEMKMNARASTHVQNFLKSIDDSRCTFCNIKLSHKFSNVHFCTNEHPTSLLDAWNDRPVCEDCSRRLHRLEEDLAPQGLDVLDIEAKYRIMLNNAKSLAEEVNDDEQTE